ncbi:MULTISPECIES: hypothetical protein [Paracoccus]|uniref:hypothetical protein n=1 Tax=Paracoccus TaxID=265 RepID=UPI00086AB2B8|nr:MULTISPECIES: hypothetical protein [Paracoccus]ODT57638.1 MAG: hypothetical protein ABS73_16060 [Paracoccus sp. SCN 68-21]
MKMKNSITWLTGCAVCAFAGMASADCAEDLARLTSETGMGAETAASTAPEAGAAEGIAKDGSLAPLETPDTGAGAVTDATADAPDAASSDASQDTADGGIAKDGSLAPLEGTEAEAGTEVAMSGQDVQAQQDGEPTAAEAAEAAAPDTDATEPTADHDGLIEEARTALAAGDEDACRAAVEQIDAM